MGGGEEMLHGVSAMEKAGQGTACSKWQRGKKQHWESWGEEAESFGFSRENIWGSWTRPEEREWAAGRFSHTYKASCSEVLLLLVGQFSLFTGKHQGKKRGCCWGFGPLCILQRDDFFCISLPKCSIFSEGCQEAVVTSQVEQCYHEVTSKPLLPPAHLLTPSLAGWWHSLLGNPATCRQQKSSHPGCPLASL